MAYFVILLTVSTLVSGCLCVEHKVNWTLEGVDHYKDEPLQVMFGDVVRLMCPDDMFSNVVYVKERVQYEECNSSLGERETASVGQCLKDFSLITSISLTIERSSTNSDGVVFEPGLLYYYYSYSDGSFPDANPQPPFSGGQCLEGLKMIIAIEEQPQTITMMPPKKTPDSEGNSDSGSSISRELFYILGGIVILIVVIVVAVVIGVLCLIKCSRKKSVVLAENSGVVPVENGKGSETPSSNPTSVQVKNANSSSRNDSRNSAGRGNKVSSTKNGGSPTTGRNAKSSSRNDGGENKNPSPQVGIDGNKVTFKPDRERPTAGRNRDSNRPPRTQNGRANDSTPHNGSRSTTSKHAATRPPGGKTQTNSVRGGSVSKNPTQPGSVRSPARTAPGPPPKKKEAQNIGDFRMH